MKRSEMTVGTTVENRHGDRYRVVSTDGWVHDPDGWRSSDTGFVVDGHPIYAVPRRAAKGERTACVLLVPEVALYWKPPGRPISGTAKQPRYLFPEGTYTGPREEYVAPAVVVESVSLSKTITARVEAARDTGPIVPTVVVPEVSI